jgi:hypothetical protein
MFSRPASLLAASLLWISAAVAQPATVVLNFDMDVTAATEAFPIMQSKGLVGTFFNDPLRVGTRPYYATKPQLVAMKAAGWEIGLYLIGPEDANLTTMYASSPTSANDLLKAGIDEMWALGFRVVSVAPTQRTWNADLAELAKYNVTGVRVVDLLGSWQTYPIPNPLYVRRGATPSLSGSDT